MTNDYTVEAYTKEVSSVIEKFYSLIDSYNLFGKPSTIYMASHSSKVKIQATSSYGAKIVLCESRALADEKVKQAANEKGTYWIPPFNHEQVIAGQGTAVLDSINEIGEVDAVFAPCGGGGLLSGGADGRVV